MSWLFPSGGQSIRASVLAEVFPVLPMNIQAWFPLGLTSMTIFSHNNSKHQFFSTQPSLWSNSQIYTWLLEKPSLWPYGPLSAKWSLLFNMLSRFVISFPTRSKCLLILWLQSLSAGILEPKKIKSDSVSTLFPSICHEVMGPDATILVFICNYLLCKISGLFKYTKYLGWKLL